MPGKTPYTKLSELQNAETSAWGRAIVAVLASESKSVASAEDVRNRQADHDAPVPADNEPDELACTFCDAVIAGARWDKEPMRAHMVKVHSWVRLDDGSVIAKKDPLKDTTKRAVADGSDPAGDAGLAPDGRTSDTADPGDGAHSHDVGRTEPETAHVKDGSGDGDLPPEPDPSVFSNPDAAKLVDGLGLEDAEQGREKGAMAEARRALESVK